MVLGIPGVPLLVRPLVPGFQLESGFLGEFRLVFLPQLRLLWRDQIFNCFGGSGFSAPPTPVSSTTTPGS
jgi:hypothetical protein